MKHTNNNYLPDNAQFYDTTHALLKLPPQTAPLRCIIVQTIMIHELPLRGEIPR